eukprot:11166563-Lingulodinium_polyedra.AAC.1
MPRESWAPTFHGPTLAAQQRATQSRTELSGVRSSSPAMSSVATGRQRDHQASPGPLSVPDRQTVATAALSHAQQR